MNGLKIETILGKYLNKKDLEIINKYRKIEFNSNTNILPNPNNEEWNKPYFLVFNERGLLVSFGRLHLINLNFYKVSYSIFGIATILSIEKGKGYGKLLMDEIKKYIENSKMTALGFCDFEVTPFYEKCGFNILKNSLDKFIFSKGSKPKKPGDVIYIEGKDKLIEKIIKNPEEKITVFHHEW